MRTARRLTAQQPTWAAVEQPADEREARHQSEEAEQSPEQGAQHLRLIRRATAGGTS